MLVIFHDIPVFPDIDKKVAKITPIKIEKKLKLKFLNKYCSNKPKILKKYISPIKQNNVKIAVSII